MRRQAGPRRATPSLGSGPTGPPSPSPTTKAARPPPPPAGLPSTATAPALAAQTHDVKVVYPAVRVKCPGKAGKKGCAVTLQGVTKKHKGAIETKLAKVKVKAGKTKITPLKPESHFIAGLGIAKVVLVKETLAIGGSQRTTFRRLLIR